MSTMIIPNKICPHCGGNKWYVRKIKNKDGSIRTQCVVKQKEQDNKYYLKNKSKEQARVKKYYKENKELILNNFKREHTNKVSNNYICSIIKLSIKEVPQELIIIKRKEICLKRQIKKLLSPEMLKLQPRLQRNSMKSSAVALILKQDWLH